MRELRPLVMHLVYSFDVGGLENGVVNLINRMPPERYRHTVVALTRCAEGFCERIRREDVGFVSLHKPAGHGIKLYPRLYRLFRERRPAIVHSRNLAALEAVVPARLARVPVRWHGEHGWDVSDPGGTRRKFQVLRRLYSPFVSRYVALSGHIESYLTGRVGIAPARVERICNGVDTLRFTPAATGARQILAGSPFADASVVVVGTVGRLQAVKDQLTLVRAFELARARGGVGQRLRLIIAGDGPLRGEVEAEIRRRDAARPCRDRRRGLACRRAHGCSGGHACARRFRAALAGRRHLQHHPRGHGQRPASGRHRSRRQRRAGCRGRDRLPRARAGPGSHGRGAAVLRFRCCIAANAGGGRPPTRRARLQSRRHGGTLHRNV